MQEKGAEEDCMPPVKGGEKRGKGEGLASGVIVYLCCGSDEERFVFILFLFCFYFVFILFSFLSFLSSFYFFFLFFFFFDSKLFFFLILNFFFFF